MNLRPSSIGAEPKKLAILGGLLVVAAGVYWMNRSGIPAGANVSQPASGAKAPAIAALPSTPVTPSTPRPASYGPRTIRGRSSASADDFRPTLKPPEGLDLTRVDPTLKTDLLAKLHEVSVEGGSRSLFEFYTPPPPPPPPPPKVDPIKVEAAAKAAREEAAKRPPPPPPPPPPIPLKFYGYSGALRSNSRKAFFLDGEDIVQAGENDTIRNRYKIVRIGVNSAEVEDTVAKNKQTLPLAEEAQ